MEDIEGWWEIPAICYYCSLLGDGFGLPEFSIQRLEESLAQEDDDMLLVEIFSTLSQSILSKTEEMSWRERVNVILDEHNKTNPFSKHSVDKTLSAWEKLDILYSLCELRLECQDVNGIIKIIEPWQLKVLPAGEDCNEMLYWYFTGARIYQQDRNVEFIEKRKSTRRSVKEQTSLAACRHGMKKLASETLLKLQDTPRSNLISASEGQRHWSVVTNTLPSSLLFTAKFESSIEPDEETLYRNLVKIVLPQIRTNVEEQERKMLLAGERKGLTRSGRKVVVRYKNGFVSNPSQESSDSGTSKEDAPDTPNSLTRQSKRRRTQPPQTTLTPGRRVTRSNSETTKSPSKSPSKTPKVRGSGRITRRSSQLAEFTEPPSTDTDDEVNENDEEEEEEEGEEEEEEEKEADEEKNKQERKPGRPRPNRASSPAKRKQARKPAKYLTLKEQVDTAVSARNKQFKSRTKVTPPTGSSSESPHDTPQSRDMTSSPHTSADIQTKEAMYAVMASLICHPEAWQFNEPVKEEFAPYYYTLTENPKDFNEIEQGVHEYKYTDNLQQFVDDITLVFTNCYDFNGPLNEYTKAARVLEKYFRSLMRLIFPEYKFEETSAIHPRKRPFVNRMKRIRDLKLAGKLISPQRNRSMSIDESSRESTDMNSPENKKRGDENSNSSAESTKPKRKSWSRRKKTTEEPAVSFTQLLSDTPTPYHPAAPYYSGYPPYYHPGGHYYGYHDPYRGGYYYPPPTENTAPTYIELSPRPRPPPRKKAPCKNDEEPLLFPHLPKHPLPRASLTANKVPEEPLLRDLALSQPSQINTIDSTTTNHSSEKSKEKTPTPDSREGKPAATCTKDPTSNDTLHDRRQTGGATSNTPDSTNIDTPLVNGLENKENAEQAENESHRTDTDKSPPEQSLNNEALPKETSEASPKKTDSIPAPVKSVENGPGSGKETVSNPAGSTGTCRPESPQQSAPSPVTPQHTSSPAAHYAAAYAAQGGQYPAQYNNYPVQPQHAAYYGQHYSAQHQQYYNSADPYQQYHGYAQQQQHPGAGGVQQHPAGVQLHYHHQHHYNQHHYNHVHHGYTYQQYPPSPLVGEQGGLYVGKNKQITTTGRSRGRGSRGGGGTKTPRGKARRSSPVVAATTPTPVEVNGAGSPVNGVQSDGDSDKTPGKESKKQKKIFDIRIQPKKRLRS